MQEPQNRIASFLPETVNQEARTVEVVWSTGAKVLRNSFKGHFFEELSLDPVHVDLSRLNSGAAVLDAHNGERLCDQIGCVEKAWLDTDKKEARALVRFSKRAEVDKIFNDVADGIYRNISVGYKIMNAEERHEKGEEYPTLFATNWQPFELSFVPVGADAKAQVRSEVRSETQNKGKNTLDLVQEERNRVSEILKLSRKFALCQELTNSFVQNGEAIELVRKNLIDHLATQSEKSTVKTTSIELIRDEKETKKEGMAEAILHRSSPSYGLTENGRRFRSMSLIDLAKDCVASKAYLSKEEIVTRAFHSTSDFPEILGSVAKKSLVASYEKQIQKQNFWPLVKVKSAPDFKPMRRVRMGEMPSLTELPEGAEYTYGTLGEASEEYSITTWGKGIGITRQMIINDDLGALDTLHNWGASIARLESWLFWSVFNKNQKMSDGLPLFDKKHNNKSEAIELNIETVSAARIAMAKQQGIDKRKSDFLNIQPEFLIVPVELQTQAEQFLSRDFVANDAKNINPFKGAFTLIASTWLEDAKSWYLAASPDQGIDLVEMAYLDGIRQPFVEWHTDFNTDSLRVKARMDVAAKAVDYRGFYKVG